MGKVSAKLDTRGKNNLNKLAGYFCSESQLLPVSTTGLAVLVEVGLVSALVITEVALRTRLVMPSLLRCTSVGSDTAAYTTAYTRAEAVSTIESALALSATLSALPLSLTLRLTLNLRRLLHGTTTTAHANILTIRLVCGFRRAATARPTRRRVWSTRLTPKAHEPLHPSSDLP